MKKLSEDGKLGIAVGIGALVFLLMCVGIHSAAAYITASPSIGTLTYTDGEGNEKKVPISNRPSFPPRKVVVVRQMVGVPFGHYVEIHELSWVQELLLEELGTQVEIGDGKGVVLLEGDYKSFKEVIVPDEEVEGEPHYLFETTWILGGQPRGIIQASSTPPPPPPPAS